MTLAVLLLICAAVIYSGWNVVVAEQDSEEPDKRLHPLLQQLLPSSDALEEIAVKLLDALIKRGQIAMAKSAFNTQLEVLKKVQPEQYKKYKKVPVEQLAAEAVMQQAEMARLQPKTGNKLIDMLHENGIPIGNSLKGLEQALKTQREIDSTDPSEQIAKAILEKVQKQILPSLIANIIAGKNPLQIGTAREDENNALVDSSSKARAIRMQQEKVLKEIQDRQLKQTPNAQSMQYDINPALLRQQRKSRKKKARGREKAWNLKRYRKRIPSSAEKFVHRTQVDRENPISLRLAKRKDSSRQRDIPIDSKGYNWTLKEKRNEILKEPLILDSHKQATKLTKNRKRIKIEKTTRRLSPTKLPQHIKRNLDFKRREMKYRILDNGSFEKYAMPKHTIGNPEPHMGYSIPRPIPQRLVFHSLIGFRPRIMLPLTIGVEENNESLDEFPLKQPFVAEPFSNNRRRHFGQYTVQRIPEIGNSRVLDNLRNNPALAGIFDNEALVQRLSRPSVLSSAQRADIGTRGNVITMYPRLAAARTWKALRPKPIDYKVKQIVEERPIPPPLFIPKGRHTRIRLTSATEKELPGIGGRFVIPSFDPTLPALNTAVHTQGRQRDEYDSVMKLPNKWGAGDSIGLHTKTRTERLFGGNGMADTPAVGKYVAIG